MTTQKFYAHGKLLLTGEYFVLNGATGLALPTKYGQRFEVKKGNSDKLLWTSYNSQGALWEEAAFDKSTFQFNTKSPFTERLSQILKAIKDLGGPDKINAIDSIQSNLEFPNDWGLGSSSTLIAFMSKLFEIDPYLLLSKTFGGSGYDVAIAFEEGPILYTNEPLQVQPTTFDPPFRDKIFFVHLNQKMDSREGIEKFKSKFKFKSKSKSTFNEGRLEMLNLMISAMSVNLTAEKDYKEFCETLEDHESIVSEFLEMKTIKEILFPNFTGTIKSLGAWGGDFILATCEDEDYLKKYFYDKAYNTILPYHEMIL